MNTIHTDRNQTATRKMSAGTHFHAENGNPVNQPTKGTLSQNERRVKKIVPSSKPQGVQKSASVQYPDAGAEIKAAPDISFSSGESVAR